MPHLRHRLYREHIIPAAVTRPTSDASVADSGVRMSIPQPIRRWFVQIVRCRRGHFYTTWVLPGGPYSLTGAIPSMRYQYCPVGRHWTWARRVDERLLSPLRWRAARSRFAL